MAVNWNLQAVEILEILGCTRTGGKEIVEEFERKNGVKVPKTLYEFLCVAWNNPLFHTADIWTEGNPAWSFFYGEIDEMIESDHKYWEEEPEDYEDNDYYQMFKIPREEWNKTVPDYLLIGSDYAAGVVEFGIRVEDLAKDNPPVYMQHEADPITVWSLYSNTVSDFIMQMLCDVLSCVQYHTAQGVLEKAGWTFQEFGAPRRGLPKRGTLEDGYALLRERGVDLSQAVLYRSDYGADAHCRCGWDPDAQAVYITHEDSEDSPQNHIVIYSKA